MNKHMDYKKFVEMFCQRVNEAAKNWDGAKVEFQPDIKEDGKAEDLLVVTLRENGTPGAHAMSIEIGAIYKSFTSGYMDLEQVWDMVEDWFSRAEKVEAMSPVNEIGDYEKIRDHLIIRPINYTRNKEKLEGGIYFLVGDIALVLYAYYGFINNNYISALIAPTYLDLWHKDKEEVLKNAMVNTRCLFQPVVLNEWEPFPFMDTEISKEEFMQDDTALVTYKHPCDGAVSIFLPGVARRVGEILNSDLYIAFLGCDAVIIHDVGKVQPGKIRETISAVNNIHQDDNRFLSDMVFVYRRDTDRIDVVEEDYS